MSQNESQVTIKFQGLYTVTKSHLSRMDTEVMLAEVCSNSRPVKQKIPKLQFHH